MYIHNATFMVELAAETRLIEWLRAELPAICAGEGAPLNPRLSSMREAGGVDYRHAEAQSVAFQVEFPDLKRLQEWRDSQFAGIAAEFERRFAPAAMVFTSIFESIPLK